jgi:ubiquinone/menaquinone biosynthesis C-methylase UbiE
MSVQAASTSNPQTRFSDRADVYSRARPTYPADAMDAIVAGAQSDGATIAADIGAGTGISSRLLAERGCRVFAIEPNADMRRRGAADTSAVQPPITWVEACGEATTLGDASVDLILCAQSFHWLDRPRALNEFHRILRPYGRLAMLWNIQNRDEPFTAGYCNIMSRHAVEMPRSPWALPGVAADMVEDLRFAGYRVLVFPHEQTLDRDGLVERAMSASYAPKSGQAFLAMATDLRELFDRFERKGRATLRYKTEVHLAERAP